jgi:hypothetical protein
MSIIMSHLPFHSSTTMSVPLPPRPNASVDPPVWSIDNTTSPVQTPASTPKCSRPNGVCCKELIDEERTLVDPDVVRDVYASLFDIVFKILIKNLA